MVMLLLRNSSFSQARYRITLNIFKTWRLAPLLRIPFNLPPRPHPFASLTRKLPTLRASYNHDPPSPSCLIDDPIEEATLASYQPDHFHPTHPDQLLTEKYRTIAKLGYGAGSTVWLAEDLECGSGEDSKPRYVAVKIGALGLGSIEQEVTIATAAPQSGFTGFLRLPIDNFNLDGPAGSYLCLVYAPMRESLGTFQWRDEGKDMMPLFTKTLAVRLLSGVYYLHGACRLIHTDIKEENILLSVEDPAVLDDFVREQRQTPQTRHVSPDGRATYQSHRNLGPLRSLRLNTRLSDFNMAFPFDPEQAHLDPAVQPHKYRAPEVLLGTGWSAPIDIWNMGLVIWKMMQGGDLFESKYMRDKDGEYNALAHLAQMISYLGPPPRELVKREQEFRAVEAEEDVINPQGKPCKTVCEFWGGPFFDDNGEFIRQDLVRPGLSLESSLTTIEGEEKTLFLDLIRCMLEWMPEERPSARQLMAHPYFESLRREVEGRGAERSA